MAKPDRPVDRRVRASRRLSLAGIALLIIIVIVAGWAVWDRREDAIARSRQEIANLGIVLAEQTARAIQAVDLVLHEIPALALQGGVESPDQFAQIMSSEDVHRLLADRLKTLPQAEAIELVGADGKVINGSGMWPLVPEDVSDRDFYARLGGQNDQDAFIGAPVASRIAGAWAFRFARRINGPHGEFLGIVLAAIDIGYFEKFYRAITFQDGGSIAVFRRDGTMLARYPHVEQKVGEKLAPQSAFYARVAEGGGSYRSPGYVDGIARVVSVHPLRDFPLVVTVTVSADSALANWRRETLLITIGTLCAIVGFALLFRALVAQSRSLEQSEATLRDSEARFRDFALTSSDWLWETDENHRFTYQSDHVRAFGHDPRDTLGRTRFELAGDAHSEPAKWQDHYALLERHEPFREFVYTWNSGDRIVSVSGRPHFDHAERFLGYRGTARDITEKVLAERRQCEAKAAAEAANLAKSQFLANMSHELRTPLNAILGFSEVLEHGIAGPLHSRQQEYVALIRQSGARLLRVINEILDIACIDAGKFELHEEPVDPRQVIDSCVSLVGESADAGSIRLSVEIEDDVPRLIADRSRLVQILVNLLSNAVEFTERGGLITLVARRAQNGGIEFQVTDAGPGMAADEIRIALEPFRQVDTGLARQHQGTGLGLPIARKLTELHGGSLLVESATGCGTTVTVALPPTRVLSALAAANSGEVILPAQLAESAG